MFCLNVLTLTNFTLLTIVLCDSILLFDFPNVLLAGSIAVLI